MTEALIDQQDPAEIAAELFGTFDQLMARMAAESAEQGDPIECGPCSWCCAQKVDLTTVEAVLIAETIRRMPDRVRIERRLRNVRDQNRVWQDDNRQRTERVACPLLVDGRCSVYAVRPLVCRAYMSRSRAGCELAYRTGEEPESLQTALEAAVEIGYRLAGGDASNIGEIGEMVLRQLRA